MWWAFALLVVFLGGVVAGGMAVFTRRGPVLMHTMEREVYTTQQVLPVVVSQPAVIQPDTAHHAEIDSNDASAIQTPRIAADRVLPGLDDVARRN